MQGPRRSRVHALGSILCSSVRRLLQDHHIRASFGRFLDRSGSGENVACILIPRNLYCMNIGLFDGEFAAIMQELEFSPRAFDDLLPVRHSRTKR